MEKNITKQVLSIRDDLDEIWSKMKTSSTKELDEMLKKIISKKNDAKTVLEKLENEIKEEGEQK